MNAQSKPGRRMAPRVAAEKPVTSGRTLATAALGVVVTIAAVAGSGLAGRATGTADPAATDRTEKLSRTVSCAGGLPGSRAVSGALAGSVQPAGTDARPIDKPATVTADPVAAPSSFATQFAQSDRWLAAAACADPQAEWWFVGAGGSRIHQGDLLLTNPLPGDAVVDVEVYGAKGPVDAPGLDGLTIGEGETRRLNLADVAPQVGDLAVHVVAARGLVSASMPESWARDFLAKQARDWVPGQPAAAKSMVLGGLPAKPEDATLVTVNPGDTQADVSIRFVDDNGSFRPTKIATVVVPPQSVQVTRLGGVLSSWPQAIRLSSDQPVSATVRSVRGADESYASVLAPLGRVAVAGVPPTGTAKVRVTATGAGGQATLVFRDGKGQRVGSRTFTVKDDASLTIDVPGAARSAELTDGGSLSAALVLEAGADRIAAVPFVSVVAESRVPQAHPTW